MRTDAEQKGLRKRPQDSREPPWDWDVDAWERTDRLIRYPSKRDAAPAPQPDVHRSRVLAEKGIEIEFLDAGIGCCWFAYQGDNESASGESEEQAIERLAAAGGETR